MQNNYKFVPTKVADTVSNKLFIERLPEWMQNVEQIQKFSDDIIQQWFNPVEEEVIDGYIGDIGSPAAAGKIFLKESSVQRQLYQLSPAYVSRNVDNTVNTVQFYEDLVNYLKSYGALTENQDRLFSAMYYAWTPPINPNKIQNFGSYVWDTENEFGVPVDYIVMERGSIDGNTWSLQNFWYTIGQKLPNGVILTESMLQDKRFARAQAPIIEFNKNIELMNHGSKFRGVVTYLSDSVKPEDIVQRSVSDNIKVDGYILQSGDTILFTSIGNSGENNRIYEVTIEQMADGSRVYGLILDPDEMNPERPTGEPLTGDVVLIKSGLTYNNTSVYWNGSIWTKSQEKNGPNVFPQFQLYDRNSIKLNDSVIYPSSSFNGSELFGLKINFNYGLDKIYNAHVELSEYNYYVFENFLQSQRFEYDRLGVRTEISGLYYYNVRGESGEMELKTDWVRSKEKSKQFVKQVPEMQKLSMYKVFNTLHDMNVFATPMPTMDAYVIEVDSYYKYLRNETTGEYSWVISPIESVAYDVFSKEFEISQKIDTTNPKDLITVFVNGDEIRNYEKVLSGNYLQKIILPETVNVNENTVLEIKTYSSDITPDLSLGAYEIPMNLQYNPYNENVLYVDQSTYTLHFYDIIMGNITEGSFSGINNYENRLEGGLVNNSIGHHIIQNEASMLTLMLFTANKNLDMFESIIFNQNEYFRFKNRFNTILLNKYQTDREFFDGKSPADIVNYVLTVINVGKDSTFPYALDGVGSSTEIPRTFIPPTPNFLGILKAFVPQKQVYMYAGRDIIPYNIDHTGLISKSYKAINGASILDDVVYELENRIFESIDITFKDVDYQPIIDSSSIDPTMFFKGTSYSQSEYDTMLLRGYINFIATNGINNETHEYDASNWMTWNFLGCHYSNTNDEATGSWRAIYTNAYGTYRPHTHPWEMFGFSQRPEWFNQEYEPLKVALGKDPSEFTYVYTTYIENEQGQMVPTGLWDTDTEQGDASQGKILFGKRAGTYEKYKRFGKQPFTLTDTGELNNNGEKIYKLELISPVDLGILVGAVEHAAEPWSYGDMGEMEFTYMNTPLYAFDQALVLLRANPTEFSAYFYDTKGNTLQNIVNSSEKQFLYANTRQRLNFNSNTLVHTEENVRVLGYQSWVSNYLIYQNKNVTSNFGNVLRSSYINIGHKLGGFSKADQLTFKSDAFGLISQENQHVGLVKSIVRSEDTLSAMKILWNGQGYVISGYDLIGGIFKVQVPNKLGKRTSIKIGNSYVTHFNEYKDETAIYEYGELFKSSQDLYTLICSYGEYLEQQGWIFEDSTEEGVLNNWSNLALKFVEWSQTKLEVGDFISISPSTKIAKFGSYFGSVESVTQFNGGVWSLMDDENQGIRQFEINTARIGNVFTVRVNEDVDKRMGLVRLHLSSYEHAVVFDDTTIFGDSLYIPLFGSVFEMLKVYGYRTANWNGRLEAKGFIILESGTMPNFEKLVTDFKNYYDSDAIVDNNTIQDLSRHLIGYQTRNYISQMITSEPAQVDFYKGFIKDKGTNVAFERVLRVSKTYNTENYKALQEWAFKVGTYGNVYGKKHLQFQLKNDELAQQPQLFIFNESDDIIDNTSYIQYYGTQGEDPRWITRPKDSSTFPMRSGRSMNIRLPDIGPVTLPEVSYSTKDFSSAYVDRINYENKSGKVPSSVWMIQDVNQTWNIFELKDSGCKLKEIKPLGGDDLPGRQCELILDKPHNLTDGEYFYFVDKSEFMPDLLKQERQFFSTGSTTSIVVPLNVLNNIIFGTEMPSMFVYKARYNASQKQEYTNKKYTYEAPESKLFARPSTYNNQTNITEMYLNVYDPINGVIPGSIMSNIDYVDSYDPAKYNSTNTTLLAWGSERVGEVWWDTTNAYFIDYTRPIVNTDGTIDEIKTLEYKRTHWGELLPCASIDVYEWVASPVLPFDWETYCSKQSTLNKSVNSWVPSGEALNDQYSEFQEYDHSTNSYNTVYYFWVKNTIYLPKVMSRTKSCFELARSIENPLLLNTPWFAPIEADAFIISGIEREITDDKSVLTIEYTLDETEVIKHEQFQLCREGEEYNFNKNIWDSMWNSLRSSEQLPDGKVLELSYPQNELGILPTQTWFMDTMEARREYVQSSNDIFKNKSMITNTVVMNEIFYVKTEEVNPDLVQIKVLSYNNELVIVPNEDKFVENDAVLVDSQGTLPEPLNSSSVYFVHFDDNGYIHLMNNPSAGGNAVTITLTSRGEGALTMIKQEDYIESLGTSLDMTNYWSLADWYEKGYSENTAYTSEKSLAIADTKNYQEDDVIRVVDSSGLWTLYTLRLSRGTPLWTAVGRQDSTVALNDNIFSGYQQYNEDGTPTNTELNVRNALGLLKGAYEGFQSPLVFDLVKYVHVEQSVVDWVFKTSYIYILGLDQTLQKSYIQNDNFINQIVDYFEEVKPYRTKIRSQIEQKTSDEDEINGIVNDLDPNGYVFVDGKWVKSQKDIWDYEYAKYNESTKKWEVVGQLPDDFQTPNRRFQEMNIVMVYDNFQCKPEITYTTTELKEASDRYTTQTGDKLTDGNYYKLQRFEFTTPAVNSATVERSITQELALIYPSVDPTGDLQTEIDKLYKAAIDNIPLTDEITANINAVSESVYNSDPSCIEVEKYTQYNTLSNRLGMFSSRTPEEISIEVGCPFKGVVLSDNTNTRLPMGFSPSNTYNYGYFMYKYSFVEVIQNKVKKENPSFSDSEVSNYLSYEYGIYNYIDEIDSNGRNYTDAIRVLTVMRNTFDKNASDPYGIAEQIIKSQDSHDASSIILIPRKLVRVRDINTQEVFEVPFDQSIEDYMENSFNTNGAVLEIIVTLLDDMKIDPENPVYAEIQNVITEIRQSGYFDDMNSFDNLGLESQYQDVEFVSSGVASTTTDPYFVDISSINPQGMDITNLSLSVSGYSYDVNGMAQLKDQGRFQIEGLAMLNPYKKTEAIVSIPRYDEAIEYMNKDLISRNEIDYICSVRSIDSLSGAVTMEKGHGLKTGDTVMVFTPDCNDLEIYMIDGTWKKVLPISSIMSNNRPIVFTVTSVNGDKVTIGGLVFTNTHSRFDPDMMNSEEILPLNIVKVRTFGSSEFIRSGVRLYSDLRTYKVSVMDYDVFYDRLLCGGKFNQVEYDVMYCSNETLVNEDGVYIDHGFNLPIYGAGALSEKVRTHGSDHLQIYVYEYVKSTINPVFDGTKWTYTGNVVDGMFINDKPSRMSVLIKDNMSSNTTFLATPTEIEDCSITNFTLTSPNAVDGSLVVVESDIIELRNSGKMNQGRMGSPTQYFIPSTTVQATGIILGNAESIEPFMSGEDPIPSARFYNGKVISGATLEKIIK